VVDKLKKAHVLFGHYDTIQGNYVNRSMALHFGMLNLSTPNMVGLDHCFSEDEVWGWSEQIPPNKAQTGWVHRLFYQTTWPIMQGFHSLRSVSFHSFYLVNQAYFYLVNQAYLILLQKKQDTQTVQDFRSISFIHSFSKLITKTLSLRLAPFMDTLIMPNQSIFIKGRVLHDNFKTVQLTTKMLHIHRIPSMLLKIDIAKVFDTVS
jgi:hypothetical protein